MPPPNHVAHSGPLEVSRTRSYGVKNSIPRWRTAASQNHSVSSAERRRSSRQSSIPCSRMNAVTRARSIVSCDGVQMTGGDCNGIARCYRVGR